jgi:glycosyltransferase involved in cell wall biosynthesis
MNSDTARLDPTAALPESAAPLRVLLLSAVGEIGGAERVVLDLIRFAQPGVRFALICMADGPLVAAAREAGAERVQVCPWPERLNRTGDSGIAGFSQALRTAPTMFASLALSLPGFERSAQAVNRAVAEWRPHVIHSNNVKTHLLSRRIRPGAAKLIWHLHDLVSSRRLARHLLPRMATEVDAFVAVSDAVAKDAREVFGPSAPVTVVHNGIDTSRFAPAVSDPSVLGRVRPGLRVGLIATFARWKGQDVFIDAVARLSPDIRSRATFYIVGGPIYRTGGSQWSASELEARIDRAGLRGSMCLTGFVSELPEVYRALDVVVHASKRPEPFGLTIAEAMACGRATIASYGGGAIELFEDGKSALAVPMGDAAGLSRCLEKLILDAGLRRQLGAAARQRILAHFNMTVFAGAWQHLYTRVTTRRGDQRG